MNKLGSNQNWQTLVDAAKKKKAAAKATAQQAPKQGKGETQGK